MKVVILAGGYGTRLLEETVIKPKPMVEIGGRPILWHIMSSYASYGFKEFVVALGYKGDWVKSYFLNRYHLTGNLTVDLASGKLLSHSESREDWTIHLIDTGLNTSTGGRLWRLRDMLKDSTFMMTYGDGVSNVNLRDLVAFHKSHGKIATVTAVHPPARFGVLTVAGESQVTSFGEKPRTSEGWINGGFFVMEPEIFDHLSEDSGLIETTLLTQLAEQGQLHAFKHDDFWQCMDTLRDVKHLEELWESGHAPWSAFHTLGKPKGKH